MRWLVCVFIRLLKCCIMIVFKYHSLGWRLSSLLQVVPILQGSQYQLIKMLLGAFVHFCIACVWDKFIVSCCVSSTANYWETRSKVLSFVTARWSIFHWVYKVKMGMERLYVKAVVHQKSLLETRGIFTLLEQKSCDALAYLLQQGHRVVWFHKPPPQHPWARHVSSHCSRGIVLINIYIYI